MSDRYDMGFNLDNMVPAPAGTATPKVMFKSEDGIMQCYGTTVPSDEAEGYAPSCIFHKVDGTTLDTVLYVNIGTKASCNFDAAILAS